MAKKAKKATKKKIVRREWTKENIKEIKAHSKAKTPESDLQISAVLDTIARDYFSRALRHQSKK